MPAPQSFLRYPIYKKPESKVHEHLSLYDRYHPVKQSKILNQKTISRIEIFTQSIINTYDLHLVILLGNIPVANAQNCRNVYLVV